MRNNERIARAEKWIFEAIAAKHPPLPEWVRRNVTVSWGKKERDVLNMRILLYKKRPLKEGYFWETRDDGSKIIATYHETTGEKLYCISYDDPDQERVVVFEVDAHMDSGKVTFLQEAVIADLSPDEFELNW